MSRSTLAAAPPGDAAAAVAGPAMERSVFSRGQEVDAIVAAYDFPEQGTVVDVSGGDGLLAAAVLRARPGLSGVVYDRPPSIPAVTRTLADGGLQHRARGRAGDFFESVPAGGDLYLLKGVIHDRTDAEALAILRNVRLAMPKRARLLVIERVMSAGHGGRERTETEYAALFETAGLELRRSLPTSAGLSVLECAPARARARVSRG